MNDTTAQKQRTNWPVIALALLFIGPLAVAGFVYYAVPDWRPGGQVNHGELIQPPVLMPEITLAGPDGEALTPEPLRRRWTLIYVDSSGCAARCEDILFQTWQVRYLLHRDLDRVRRILVYTGEPPDPALIAERHRDLLVADASAAGAPALLAALPPEATTAPIRWVT